MLLDKRFSPLAEHWTHLGSFTCWLGPTLKGPDFCGLGMSFQGDSNEQARLRITVLHCPI